jgi:hypothetical protein
MLILVTIRAHVIRDLRPYVCTYEQCLSSEQLYDTRDDWIQHEISTHQKIFRCFEHEEETFTTLGAYEEHVRVYHEDNAVSAKFAISTIKNVHRSCPVCSVVLGSVQKLQSHIALHLERFAMFSLPRLTNISEESETGSNVFTSHSENEKSIGVDLDSESIVADKTGDDQFDTITDIKRKESLLLSIPEDDYDLLSGHQSPPRLIYQFSDDGKEYGDDDNDLFARYADSDPPSSPERVYSPAVSSARRSNDSLDQLESKMREDEETIDENTRTGSRLPSPVKNVSQAQSERMNVGEEEDEKDDETQRLEEEAQRQRLIARMNDRDTARRSPRRRIVYGDEDNRFYDSPEQVQDDMRLPQKFPVVINLDGLSTAEEAPSRSLDAFGLTDSDRESTTTTSGEGSQTVLEDSEDIGQPRPPMVRKKSGELAQQALRGHTRPSSTPGTSQVAEAVSSDSHPEHVHHSPQADQLLTTGTDSLPMEVSKNDTGAKPGYAGSHTERTQDRMLLNEYPEAQEDTGGGPTIAQEIHSFHIMFEELKSGIEQEIILESGQAPVVSEAQDLMRQINLKKLEIETLIRQYENERPGDSKMLIAQKLSFKIRSWDMVSVLEAIRRIRANRKEREAVSDRMKKINLAEAKDTTPNDVLEKEIDRQGKMPEEHQGEHEGSPEEFARQTTVFDEAERKAKESGESRAAERAPIKFKDAVGRKFSFPFHLCSTWEVCSQHRLESINILILASC